MSVHTPSAPQRSELPAQLADKAAHVTEQISEAASQVIAEAKPRLRGWLHAATAPLTLAAGVALVLLSPAGAVRAGSAVFAFSALTLFSISATMHTGTGRWSPRAALLLKRLDHACIFLLIAGSYTPFALLLLEGSSRAVLLCVAWTGAALGMAFRVLWTEAPRWLYTPVYIAMGWVSVFFFPQFVEHGSTAVVSLIAVGGLLYTLGGVIYGLRRPNPFPSWFGFHELFHALTIVAFAAHYTGILLATTALR
jgi:hemolysin III